MEQDLRKTLNLPRTSFPMKAGLQNLEKRILKKWQEIDLYRKMLKEREGREVYLLHDGPPYANGLIHIGHTLNKILKDIILRYKALVGFRVPFVPGWDCHGLPIEHELLKQKKAKKEEIERGEFRRQARNFSLKFVEKQKKDFIRLGVLGDWENPYLTLKPKYEAEVLRLLGKLVKEGYIYRGLKPVNWCMHCRTALAEAEIEYQNKESPSIYVKFPLKKEEKGINLPASFLVWTTTPWTLISNVAVAVHPDLEYVLAEKEGEGLVFARALAEALGEKGVLPGYKVKRTFIGKELEGVVLSHPFLERDSGVVLADYVSAEEGTGCVHIAPGHGEEDYRVGQKYGLKLIMPVDEEGCLDESCGVFSRRHINEAGEAFVAVMKEKGNLVLAEKITHSYPHCWRCKNPLIFRATPQWFLNVEEKNLRKRVLENIEKVKWVPEGGRERISSMVGLRPDWCLSRQRLWGVPIPAIKCSKCGASFLPADLIFKLAEEVEKKGSDVWFDINLEEILPQGFSCSCSSRSFSKEFDILDVWFESGASFQAVLKADAQLKFPADLYLEGSDQHRGWFQVSLINSVASLNEAPFREVLTHGFVVDAEGKKMSKSLGNVVAPQEIIERYGAEILRLWCMMSDYREDIKISEEIIKQLVDSYRKIRNTIRFGLGNLYDFEWERHRVNKDQMREVDRLILSRLFNLVKRVKDNFDNFLLYKVYQNIYSFCAQDLSAFYFDILKDRLYTFAPDSLGRRSAQTAVFLIVEALIKMMAPFLSFTAEEAYEAWGGKKESVMLEEWPGDKLESIFLDLELEEKWDKIFALRQEVMKALEEKRTQGVIASSLEAEVDLQVSGEYHFLSGEEDILREAFIVSAVHIKEGDEKKIEVRRSAHKKCRRCWNFRPEVGKNRKGLELCSRCLEVVEKLGIIN